MVLGRKLPETSKSWKKQSVLVLPWLSQVVRGVSQVLGGGGGGCPTSSGGCPGNREGVPGGQEKAQFHFYVFPNQDFGISVLRDLKTDFSFFFLVKKLFIDKLRASLQHSILS